MLDILTANLILLIISYIMIGYTIVCWHCMGYSVITYTKHFITDILLSRYGLYTFCVFNLIMYLTGNY